MLVVRFVSVVLRPRLLRISCRDYCKSKMAVVKLTDTWILENYAQVFQSIKVGEAKKSPRLAALVHFAFPGLKWRIELYPRGNARAMPGFASFFVEAVFGSGKESISNVWAVWTLTVVADDASANLQYPGETPDEYVAGDCISWGRSSAFLQDALNAATKNGHLEIKLDLTLLKIIDLLKCRDTVRALLSASQHADITVNVEGKAYKAHKAILAKRCTGFLETVPVGTTADAYSAFLGAVYCDQFNFLTNWQMTLGVLRLSDEFRAVELEELCDNALAHLIPALEFSVVLQILPEAIQRNAQATLTACIRVLCEKEEVLISAEWSNFKATEGLYVFQAICDALLAKSTSGQLGSGELKEFCDDGLAVLIPSLSYAELLQILPAIIRHDALAAKMKAACIRVLCEKNYFLTSADWTKFKATQGIHVFQAICDALLENTAPGSPPAKADYRAPEVTLSHTWAIAHADLLNAIASEATPLTSPLFLEHTAFPFLKWQLQFYPRGNTQAADHKQGFASIYLKAIFGPGLADLKAVYAKWNATIIVNDMLQVSISDSADFVLYTGAKEMAFGYANAFSRSEKFGDALEAFNSSFAIKLDLTIASVPEILKCRDLFSSLHSDKTHADVEIDVNGTVFKAHKFILAIRSAVLADMIEIVTIGGKLEIKDSTPQAFKAFMAGVYYENWDYLSDMDATIDVLKLAERYGVADLKRYCDEALAHFANESNVSKILPLAAIQNANATKIACFEILLANEEMVKSGGWEKFKTHTDVDLHVDCIIFKAHKSFLSARSAVFARMFETDMEENKSGKVEVEDTTPEAFEVFFDGLYYDAWSLLSDMDAAIDVLILAERYGVADLKRYCDDALAQFANESNVLTILLHAAMQHADAALAACIEILFANNKEMMKSDDWITFKKDNKDIMADIFEAAANIYGKDRQG